MIRHLSLISALLLSMPALAQSETKPANDDANTPAVASPNTTNPSAPVSGANSFTEDQARKRITDAGFTDVSALTKDDKGVWRGKANKGGAETSVSVDFQGNVVGQ